MNSLCLAEAPGPPFSPHGSCPEGETRESGGLQPALLSFSPCQVSSLAIFSFHSPLEAVDLPSVPYEDGPTSSSGWLLFFLSVVCEVIFSFLPFRMVL